jgi:glycosyltransferase involved in cell wall biosynthesis
VAAAVSTQSRRHPGPPALRVCHIASGDLWAGAEVYVATIASYLVGRPEVRLCAVLLNEGHLAHELRRLGVQVAVVDETQTSTIGIVTFLTRFLRHHEVDVVHTHRYKESVLGTIAAKLAGVPHVIRQEHGLTGPVSGWPWTKLRAYIALDRAVLWCFADLVIAVSKQLAEAATAGRNRPKVTYIHNGVDLGKVKARRPAADVRRELGIGSGDIVIGTAGRLMPVKGHEDFLRAAAQVLAQEADVQFVIVGDGPLRDDLPASARRLRVDGRCVFTGLRSDTYDLIEAMDIFVLSSRKEGLPLALLEAMALARPVVATAVGGVPEVIRHGVTGLLVRPGDPRALADACLALIRRREWAATLGVQARRVVEQEFSHEKNGQAVVETYRRVVGDHARALA